MDDDARKRLAPWRLGPELHIDTFIGRASCDYLRATEGPWCLVASSCGPHNPFDPPPPYGAVHNGTEFPPHNLTPGEPSRRPREPYDYIAAVAADLGAARSDLLTDADLQRIRALYHGNVTQIDDLDANPAEQDNLWDTLGGSPTRARLPERLLEWAFESEDRTPLPARLGHVEPAPPLLEMVGGKAVPQARQPWHLDRLRDF